MYHLWCNFIDGKNIMLNKYQKLEVVFFRTDSGNEPVREWLKALSKTDKKLIGEDIKTAQFG